MHGLRNLASEMDYRDGNHFPRYDIYGTAEILNSYREKISVGQPIDGISELGGLHRQLLQETDFHSVNNVLLKKRTIDEEREIFFDARYLPEDLRNTLESLDFAAINTSSLRQTISHVQKNGDEESLNWIAENYEEFIETEEENSPILEDIEYIEGRNIWVEKSKLSAPRDSYNRVEVFKKNPFSEAKERRNFHLKERLSEIQEINGLADIEKFIERIKPVYEEDMKLIRDWSDKERLSYRTLYEQFLRARKLDEESIRRRLWFRFDKKSKRIVKSKIAVRPVGPEWWKHFSEKEGLSDKGLLQGLELRKLEKNLQKKGCTPYYVDGEVNIRRSSYWDYIKSLNFCRLNHSRSQWKIIYDKVWKRFNYNVLIAIRSSKNQNTDLWIAQKMRRLQYRLELDPIIFLLLKMTADSQTEIDRTRVRIYLSAIQFRMPEDIRKFIVKKLSKKEKGMKIQCALLSRLETKK